MDLWEVVIHCLIYITDHYIIQLVITVTILEVFIFHHASKFLRYLIRWFSVLVFILIYYTTGEIVSSIFFRISASEFAGRCLSDICIQYSNGFFLLEKGYRYRIHLYWIYLYRYYLCVYCYDYYYLVCYHGLILLLVSCICK
jgi:hypothetical protein